MRHREDYTFSQVPRAEIPRSLFSRSHCYKTTFDAGWLIPFYVDEVLPGDTTNLRVTMFARLNTPIVPVMDNMYMDTFFFFVPNRLIWSNWQKFCGEQVNPGDSIDYLVPEVQGGAFAANVGDLFDYMGIPTGIVGVKFSSLYPRAYALIWNQWFRDENLQNSVTVPMGDGPENLGSFALQRRGKRHDYFTSCLPWPQKGAGVLLPLGTTAPVKTQATDTVTGAQAALRVLQTSGSAPTVGGVWTTATGPALRLGSSSPGTLSDTLYPSNLYADLAGATAATINSLRQAFQIQKLLERDARGGTRYTEIVKSHFGVTSPDARLQRPEFLGGGSVPVIINPVAQTSNTPVSGTPQGNLAAFGTVASHTGGFTKSFVEHGVLIGLVMVRGDLTYQQGLPRHFSRRTRYDFYWPAFSHLGEQAVLNKEIYYQGTSADDQVFGYQERWAEYRYFPSQVTGLFRSTAAGTLELWHLAQKFTSLPTLSSTFIVEDPPVDRVVAVPSEPHFKFDSFFEIRVARPMPVYSVPGMLDHF